VRFERAGDRLMAIVADDGVGFDPAAVARDGREHLGLLGMQERVALIGGDFRLHTSPGAGTRVEIEAVVPSTGPATPSLSKGALPHA
jgi:signal transduction histidine kinase